MIDNVSNENDLFDLLASRFAMAALPLDVCSDKCVTDSTYPDPRTGTNLLTLNQAEEVLRQVVTPDMVEAMLAEPAPVTTSTALVTTPSTTTEEYEAHDISSEEFRIYTYDGGSIFKIVNPVTLSITKSGSHRVEDAQGLVHRPTPGYLGITWKSRAGKPSFVM